MAKLQSAFFALCLVLAFPVAAFAEDKPKSADDWAEEAFALVQKGDFPKAIAAYQRAYQISADGRNLYNIANIYDRKLHERDLAGDYYRRYLHLPQTEPDLVKKANERLGALKEEDDAIRRNGPALSTPAGAPAGSGQSSIVVTPVGTQQPSAEADRNENLRSTMRIAGIATGGVGIALLGAGAVFGLIAKSKNDDAAKLCTGSVCNSPEAINLTDDARRAATFSTVGFIAGGVAVAGGILLYVLAPPSEKKVGSIHVSPRLGPQVAGITIGGVWR
ncbi:hypothetical protein [Pendulispora albinea]|uniref:Tetratricopeptide repeat protein n=1 Tax=Pendulispora albinea TaxID=2741071 RepID=A0ABZ2LNM4_9BACT